MRLPLAAAGEPPSFDLAFELCNNVAILLAPPRRRRRASLFASATAGAAARLPFLPKRKQPQTLTELPVGLGTGMGGGGGGGGGVEKGRLFFRSSRRPSFLPCPGPSRRRYVWDGTRVRPVSPASAAAGGEDAADAAADSARRARGAAWRSFFPAPADVTPDYWSYCRWRAGHRLCSTMLTNFATQALLQAVGVGARRSLPAAAGINWLLKDGLGRLGRLSAATRFGESFDSDLKRFRFATSLLFTASVGLELATPRFPAKFLALAAAANVGKSVGLTTYISTQPSFGQSFALRGNLADITAKAQAQQMVVDTAGLALCVAVLRRGAAAAARAGGGPPRVPLALLLCLAAGDLTAIWGELKAVHLRTLNRERAELAADAWLATGSVPPPSVAAAAEPLLLRSVPARRSGVGVRLVPLEDAVASPEALTRALKRAGGRDRFLLTRRPPTSPLAATACALGVAKAGRGRLRIALRGDAGPADTLAAVLAAAAARRELETLPPSSRLVTDADAETCLDRAVATARRGGKRFAADLRAAGWVPEPFLLAPRERAGWVPLG